jgi:hypothetical protein
MSDKEKPIQTPFDKTVPSSQQERGTDNPAEERLREDIGIDDEGTPDTLEDAGEPDYADQDDRETYNEDYDRKA